MRKPAYSEVYSEIKPLVVEKETMEAKAPQGTQNEHRTRSPRGGISVSQNMTITHDDILTYVASLPDDAILPHPNRPADKEDGLLATVLRQKYNIPVSQRIWESGSYDWLEIHGPGESVSSSAFTRIFVPEEARILGQRYYNYFERYVNQMKKSEFTHFLEYNSNPRRACGYE